MLLIFFLCITTTAGRFVCRRFLYFMHPSSTVEFVRRPANRADRATGWHPCSWLGYPHPSCHRVRQSAVDPPADTVWLGQHRRCSARRGCAADGQRREITVRSCGQSAGHCGRNGEYRWVRSAARRHGHNQGQTPFGWGPGLPAHRRSTAHRRAKTDD